MSNFAFAQEGRIEIDSANGDTLVTMSEPIGLLVLNNDSVSIALDFDKYSGKNAAMYALVLKVRTDRVLSFIERDSCVFTFSKNISVTLKSVYVDAFDKNGKYNNWIHFDYPASLLSLLQNITSFEIKLYNLGQMYEAQMKEKGIEKLNSYIKNYIIKN